MKRFLHANTFSARSFCVSALLIALSCSKKTEEAPPSKLTVTTLASGFVSPNGIATDASGIVADLNPPASMAQVNDHTWYVTSPRDKSVLKVAYE